MTLFSSSSEDGNPQQQSYTSDMPGCNNNRSSRLVSTPEATTTTISPTSQSIRTRSTERSDRIQAGALSLCREGSGKRSADEDEEDRERLAPGKEEPCAGGGGADPTLAALERLPWPTPPLSTTRLDCCAGASLSRRPTRPRPLPAALVLLASVVAADDPDVPEPRSSGDAVAAGVGVAVSPEGAFRRQGSMEDADIKPDGKFA